MSDHISLVINGWTVFCHPLFLDELDSLIEQVETLKEKNPQNFRKKNATKRLAAMAKLAFEVIPQDPSLPDYTQRISSSGQGRQSNEPRSVRVVHEEVSASSQRSPELERRRVYRQGDTLGNDHKHWFRAKCFQQYRLFFRFDPASKIILFAWVNDEKNKRAYGSKTDVYPVFKKMLNSGHPPDGWDQLLKESKGALDRLNEISKKLLD